MTKIIYTLIQSTGEGEELLTFDTEADRALTPYEINLLSTARTTIAKAKGEAE